MSGIGKKMLQAASAGGSEPGSYLAVGSISDLFLLDHTVKGALTLSDSRSFGSVIEGIEFSPDGKWLAVVTQSDPRLTIIDVSSAGTLGTVTTKNISYGTGRSVSFSSDGSYLVVSAGRVVLFSFNSSTGAVSTELATYDVNGIANDADFSPNGDYIVVAKSFSDTNSVILLDHTTAGSLSLSATYNTGDREALGIGWSPDGNYVVVGSDFTGGITLLDHTTVGSLSLAATFVNNDTRDVAYRPDGNHIAFASGQSEVLFLDATPAGSLSFLTAFGTSSQTFGLAWTSDSKYVAAGVNASPFLVVLEESSPSTYTLSSSFGSSVALTMAFSPN